MCFYNKKLVLYFVYSKAYPWCLKERWQIPPSALATNVCLPASLLFRRPEKKEKSLSSAAHSTHSDDAKLSYFLPPIPFWALVFPRGGEGSEEENEERRRPASIPLPEKRRGRGGGRRGSPRLSDLFPTTSSPYYVRSALQTSH